ADRGAAAEQLAGRILYGRGQRLGGGLVLYHHPGHHMDLQARPSPLVHGDRDRLRYAGANGAEHARIAERRRIALLLQLEAAHVGGAGAVAAKKGGKGARPPRRGGEARPGEKTGECPRRNGASSRGGANVMQVRALLHIHSASRKTPDSSRNSGSLEWRSSD